MTEYVLQPVVRGPVIGRRDVDAVCRLLVGLGHWPLLMVGIGSFAAAARSLSEISPPASAMISSNSNTRSTDWTVPDRASAIDSGDITFLSKTLGFHHTEFSLRKARGCPPGPG